MTNFLKVIVFLFFSVINPIVTGFTLSKLWSWFIVPTFQVDPLRIIEALGIALIVSYVTAKRPQVENKDHWTMYLENNIFLIVFSLLTLFSGWVYQMFM